MITRHRFFIVPLVLLFLALNVSAGIDRYRLVDVIAQRDFTQTSFRTVNRQRGMHLGGVHLHRYGDGREVLYLYDSANSRVLAFLNPNWTSNNDLPDMVFGQNDSYLSGACNMDSTTFTAQPTARTLCLNPGPYTISMEENPRYTSIETDGNGNLFFLDQYNNRILMFLDPFGIDPGEGDSTADFVWGQPDFTSKTCNRGRGFPFDNRYGLSADGLCTALSKSPVIDYFYISSMQLDIKGNMWVTDLINNRVLRFPYDPLMGRPKPAADIVLGQPNMTTYSYGEFSCDSYPAGVALCQLIALRVNDETGELYVVHDFRKPRISIYQPNIWTENPTSYTYSRNIASGQLRAPGHLVFLPGNRFIIKDTIRDWNDGFRVFTNSGTLIRSYGSEAVDGTTADGGFYFAAIHGDFTVIGNTLIMNEHRWHNSVLRFDISQLFTTNRLTFTGELFGGPNYIWNNVTGLGVGSPFGMNVSAKHHQLYLSDGYRVLARNLNTAPFVGKDANFVIGQSTMFTNDSFSGGSGAYREKAGGLAVDEINNKLWVSVGWDIFAYNLPITTNNPTPVITFTGRSPGTPYGGNLPVLGSSLNHAFFASSVVFNKFDQSLWIIDRQYSRASRIDKPYTTPKVNLIIGQNNIDGTSCNQGLSFPTAKTLCYASNGTFDNFGNLYIADGAYEGNGNERILEYDKATLDTAIAAGIVSQPAANRVYGASSFTTTGYPCLSNTPCNPIGIAFDSRNRMVVLSDAYYNPQNKRVYIYDNPLRNTGYVAFNTSLDTMLPYFMGQGGFAAFGPDDVMYLQDHTWNRVLVVETNRPPDKPVYTQPANQAEQLPLTVTLEWNAVDPDGDPVRYNVYIGQTANTLQLVSPGQITTTYTPTVSGNRTYYWQIEATDGLKQMRGDIWQFKTLNTAPGTVTLSNPAEGATDQSLDVTLQWTASADQDKDPVTYNVYLGTDSNNLEQVSSSQTGTSFVVSLAGHRTYYWQIGATDGIDETRSVLSHFSTLNHAPDTANSLSPAACAVNQAVDVPLVWSPAADTDADPVLYNVYLGMDSGNLQPVSTNQSETTLITALAENTEYFWQIGTSDGERETLGEVWDFSTLNSDPATVSSLSPVNCATDQAQNVTLEWSAATGEGITYDVLLGTERDNLQVVSANQTATTYQTSILANSTTYFWRINSKNQSGETSSLIWRFSTYNNPPDAPVYITPLNASTNQSLRPVLSWNGVTDMDGDAVVYDVYLGADVTNLALVLVNSPATTFTPDRLNPKTIYYWKVVAKDDRGGYAEGMVWNFTTYNNQLVRNGGFELSGLKPYWQIVNRQKFDRRLCNDSITPFGRCIFRFRSANTASRTIKQSLNLSSLKAGDRLVFSIEAKSKRSSGQAIAILRVYYPKNPNPVVRQMKIPRNTNGWKHFASLTELVLRRKPSKVMVIIRVVKMSGTLSIDDVSVVRLRPDE